MLLTHACLVLLTSVRAIAWCPSVVAVRGMDAVITCWPTDAEHLRLEFTDMALLANMSGQPNLRRTFEPFGVQMNTACKPIRALTSC